MDKVSIIVPLYNCEKFIGKTIESVIAQTYKDWEMIIVDDASNDNSYNIACGYAKQDARIKLFRMTENKGASACRNFALQQSSGRYIAFLDSDDIWSPHKLYLQIAYMQRHKALLSHTAYIFMDEKSKIMPKGKVDVDNTINLETYMQTTQIGLSSVIVDGKHIKLHFPDDRKLCEDARVWMNLLRNGHVFHGLNRPLTLYRIRAHQLSRNKLKMATNTLLRYWNEKNLPAYKRLFYFLKYACNGVRKRLKKTKDLPLCALSEFKQK